MRILRFLTKGTRAQASTNMSNLVNYFEINIVESDYVNLLDLVKNILNN